MNEVSGLTATFRSKAINETSGTTNVPSFCALKKDDEQIDSFIKEQEKARKNAKKQQNLNNIVQIGILGTILASVGLSVYMIWGKGPAKTEFKKLSDKFPALDSGCVNPKVKEFIERAVKILKLPKEVLDYTKAKSPRFVIFYGPTGTGKTFSAQLLAKELGAKYGEIQFSDVSSEYVGKTAVNITKKFKEIKKIVDKNPNEQYVFAFNEIDSLLNNVNKLGSNNQHLGQNRTAFLNGMDLVKDCKNLTIVGTTNVNPHSGNMDLASLGRALIQEIRVPTEDEAMYAFKFQLGKYGCTDKLMNDKNALRNFAQQIVGHQGSNRDIEKLVENAVADFTVAIGDKPNATSQQLTADYIQKLIDKKEIWASSINDSTNNVPQQIPNHLIDEFWKFIAKKQGVK